MIIGQFCHIYNTVFALYIFFAPKDFFLAYYGLSKVWPVNFIKQRQYVKFTGMLESIFFLNCRHLILKLEN